MSYPKGKLKSEESKIKVRDSLINLWRDPAVRARWLSLKRPKQVKREDRICPSCGKSFQALVTRRTKYCSNQCRYIGKRKPMPKCCDCGKEVASRNARHRCRKCYYIWFHGENTGTWKGGITPENKAQRVTPEYKMWRKSVFERDEYRCVLCGNGGRLTLGSYYSVFGATGFKN